MYRYAVMMQGVIPAPAEALPGVPQHGQLTALDPAAGEVKASWQGHDAMRSRWPCARGHGQEPASFK